MPDKIIRKIEKRYIALIAAIALVFISLMLMSDVTGRMFANILGTLILLALIPFAIIFLIKKKERK